MIIDLTAREALWLYALLSHGNYEEGRDDPVAGIRDELYTVLIDHLNPPVMHKKADVKPLPAPEFEAWVKHEQQKVDVLKEKLDDIKHKTVERAIARSVVTLDDVQDKDEPVQDRDYPRRQPAAPRQGKFRKFNKGNK